jgi:hypothetical protein
MSYYEGKIKVVGEDKMCFPVDPITLEPLAASSYETDPLSRRNMDGAVEIISVDELTTRRNAMREKGWNEYIGAPWPMDQEEDDDREMELTMTLTDEETKKRVSIKFSTSFMEQMRSSVGLDVLHESLNSLKQEMRKMNAQQANDQQTKG